MKLIEPFLYTMEWNEAREEYDCHFKEYLRHRYQGEEKSYLNTRAGKERWDGGTAFQIEIVG